MPQKNMQQNGQTDTSRFIPVGIIRTQEQIAIQTASAKVLLIEANAGAAKTTTLALRIGEAVAANVVPEEILVLVFTETARDVMHKRLAEVGVHYSIVNRIDIFTFEDFSRKCLAFIEDEGIAWYPNARQQSEPMRVALDAVYERYGRNFDDLQLNTSSLAISQYLEAQLKLKAMMALPEEFDFEELESVYTRLGVTATEFLVALEYERVRLGRMFEPDFRGPFDATYDLARSIAPGSNSELCLPDYRLVACDELHDLNEAAFRIVCELIDRPRCYFVGAGDRDQVIHATLGARHEYLSSRFYQRFQGAKSLPLTITHRHGPHLAYAMAAFKKKAVESDVAEKLEIRLETYADSPEAGAQCVVDAVTKWKRSGAGLDGCAILIRDRHHAVVVENALRQAGIGYQTPIMGSYLQREEILFLRGVLALALRDFEAVKRKEVKEAIVEALDLYGGLHIPHDELQAAKAGMAKHSQLHWFYEKYIQSGEGRPSSILDETIRFASEAGPDAPAAEVLRDICRRMSLERIAKDLYVRPYDAAIVMKSIAGFLSIAQGQNVKQFFDSVNAAELFAIKYRDKDVLTLDCVANSKGKEFEHVILPFVEAGEYPNPLFPIQDEENLFYVGATRARRWLTLTTPEAGARQSPFIKRMDIGGTKARANLAQARNDNAVQSAPPSRHYLQAGYADKDVVKALGARYDPTRKKWYVPVGMDLKPFEPWF